MRVEAVDIYRLKIPFKGSFKHALSERTEAETILVRLRTEAGASGWGEILPRPYLTGETLDAVFDTLAPERGRRVLGRSFATRAELVAFLEAELDGAGRALATLGGFELALLDAGGKDLAFPAHAVLSDALGPDLPPGVVIGFEVATEALAKHCALLRMTGKRHVKVKVGLADDLVRLQIISDRLGKDAPLRLDANSAWGVEAAIEALSKMRGFNIASVEQPVDGRDLAGMRAVRERTGLRVMADESLATMDDARRLVAEGAADVFNVRVGKCGGLLGSRRIVTFAEQNGIGLHLGALVGETGVLSRAGEIFGRAVGGFDCLEGKGQSKFLLADDPTTLVQIGPGGSSDEAHGLGVEVDEARLRVRLVAHKGVEVAC